MKQKDKSVDVLKGIAMIFIVAGHTYIKYRSFMYLFHVAIFFMASGYCWKRVIRTGNDWLNYIKYKLKTLYIPYVIYNVLFLLLTNVFISINVYSNNPEFITSVSGDGVLYKQHLTDTLNIQRTFTLLFNTIILKYRPQIAGASWFITVLLAVVFFHATFELLGALIIKNRDSWIQYVILLLIVFSIPSFEVTRKLFLHWVFARVPYPFAAFLLGLLMKKAENRINQKYIYNPISFLLSIFILVLLYKANIQIDLSTGSQINPVIFILSSLAGWVLILTTAKALIKYEWLEKAFTYVGTHTIPILYLHMLAFKLVSWLYVLVNNKAFYIIASYPIVFETPLSYRLLYIFVGVLIPLGFDAIRKSIFLRNAA